MKAYAMQSNRGINKRLLAVIGLIIIVAAIATGVAVSSPRAGSATVATDVTPSPTSTPVIIAAPTIIPAPAPTAISNAIKTAAPTTSGYKDGTYTSNANYNTPGGIELISIKLTLKNGVVIDSNASTTGNNQTGRYYQANFVAGYKSQVIGRSIAGLSLTRVSGSSLTPIGFNDAVDKIKSQSKV